MPYQMPGAGRKSEACTVCGSQANVLEREFDVPVTLDCSRCGDFSISREAVDDFLPLAGVKQRALASYLIRKLQGSKRTTLTSEFFQSLSQRSLPAPTEVIDNLLLLLAEQADGSPGKQCSITYSDEKVLGTIGAVHQKDAAWAVLALKSQGLLNGAVGNVTYVGNLSVQGWNRLEELKRAHVSSRFAFFAREIAPEPTGHGLPLSKCEAYNRVYDQHSRSS